MFAAAEKLRAIADFGTTAGANAFFVRLLILLIAVMAALFVWTAVIKAKLEKANRLRVFRRQIKDMDLSSEQQGLLCRMAQIAKIRLPMLLLNDIALFERAAYALMQAESSQPAKELRLALTFLREKLGLRQAFTLNSIANAQQQQKKGHNTNRRQFFRVKVSKPAAIAPFDFENAEPKNSLVPDFRPATLIEMGGSGLKFITDMDFKAGQRVIVSFSLEADAGGFGTEFAHSRQRVVQGMAVVRNVGSCGDEKTVAVEMAGCSQNQLDMLVRAANAELIKSSKIQKTNLKEQSTRAAKEFAAI